MSLLQPLHQRTTPFVACSKGIGCPSQLAKPVCRRKVIPAAHISNYGRKNDVDALHTAMRVTAAGILASGLLWLSAAPAEAEIQTVSPQVVTQMARPLPKQTVDKGKIWTVFIGGAVALFGSALLLENNEQFFPAIVRAKQATKVSEKLMKEQEEREQKERELQQLRQAEYEEQQRQLAAVQQGLKSARSRVLPSSSPSAPSPPSSGPGIATIATSTSSSHTDVQRNNAGAVAESPSRGVPEPSSGAAAGAGSGGDAAGNGSGSVSSRSGGVGAVAEAGAAGGPVPGAIATPEEQAEAVARLTRLQGFVSDTMAGSKGAMDALKAHRQ
ncbi:hypothetical protein Agub_g5742 [Astrephomene gubernaculifera]|uniref:Uncharacterized protein n=1 Tax=Astrephomene gubernaculifera TaxID=47775 RepID=A0AAD3HKB3_9CHLO|nr:hypothetical protein Agub_g5742 [Astrephomene gubernaculifera]